MNEEQEAIHQRFRQDVGGCQVFARDTRLEPEAPLYFLDRGQAEEVRPLCRTGHLVCPIPECPDPRFTTRGGSKRDHFAHLPGTHAEHTPELIAHLVAKNQIARWLRESRPDLVVEVDSRRLPNKRKPDVLATLPSGEQVVFEVQYSKLSPGDWLKRHRDYAEAGIRDYWLFGHTWVGIPDRSDRYLSLDLVHIEVLRAGGPLLWFNPHEALVGTAIYSYQQAKLPRVGCWAGWQVSLGIDDLAMCQLRGRELWTPSLGRMAEEHQAAAEAEERERQRRQAEEARRQEDAHRREEARREEEVRRREEAQRSEAERLAQEQEKPKGEVAPNSRLRGLAAPPAGQASMEYSAVELIVLDQEAWPAIQARLLSGGRAIPQAILGSNTFDSNVDGWGQVWRALLFERFVQGQVGRTFTWTAVRQALLEFRPRTSRSQVVDMLISTLLDGLAWEGYVSPLDGRGHWGRDYLVCADSSQDDGPSPDLIAGLRREHGYSFECTGSAMVVRDGQGDVVWGRRLGAVGREERDEP